jgi:predicted porin
MKKSLVALAALAVVGAASAQSTVTLFGGADMSYRSVDSGANKFSGIATDGIYSSRIGFKGVEDLGGGMKANFHFEGGMSPDDGTAAGFNFKRKSIIGVSGSFGEVRVGRDYTPMFTVFGMDPFGTNGVGSSYNLFSATTAAVSVPAAAASTFATAQKASSTGADAASTVQAGGTIGDPNSVRANNTVAYYSPSFSGFSVGAMYGFGSENTNIAKDVQTMTSIKLAYDNGPLSLAYANQATKGGLAGAAAGADGCKTWVGLSCTVAAPASAAVLPTDDQKYTTNVFGVTYNLGMATLAFIDQEAKLDGPGGSVESTTRMYGVTAPMGAWTLKGSYITKTASASFGAGSIDAGTQFAVGAIYDLSKRTSVYGTYSVLKNEAGFGNSVGSAPVSDFTGKDSSGFEVGFKATF